MLKQDNRLTKKKDFDQVFKSGKSSFNKLLGVKSLKNDLKINRFGIVVGSKVSKKAVERNKIKRRIRAIVKIEIDRVKPGQDIVIITLPEIREKNFSEIEGAVKNSLDKLKLYK